LHPASVPVALCATLNQPSVDVFLVRQHLVVYAREPFVGKFRQDWTDLERPVPKSSLFRPGLPVS